MAITFATIASMVVSLVGIAPKSQEVKYDREVEAVVLQMQQEVEAESLNNKTRRYRIGEVDWDKVGK